jgi:hypothetical protein
MQIPNPNQMEQELKESRRLLEELVFCGEPEIIGSAASE